MPKIIRDNCEDNSVIEQPLSDQEVYKSWHFSSVRFSVGQVFKIMINRTRDKMKWINYRFQYMNQICNFSRILKPALIWRNELAANLAPKVGTIFVLQCLQTLVDSSRSGELCMLKKYRSSITLVDMLKCMDCNQLVIMNIQEAQSKVSFVMLASVTLMKKGEKEVKFQALFQH